MNILQRIVELISPRPRTEKSEPVQKLNRAQREAWAAAEQLRCQFTDAERMLKILVDGVDERDRNAR